MHVYIAEGSMIFMLSPFWISTICIALAGSWQQSGVMAAPIFDVVAIHPHTSEPHEHNSIWSSPLDGNVVAKNISVLALVHWAYEIPETRIVGGPGWTGSDHFNIEAKSDQATDQEMSKLTGDMGRHQKELMVQALLADRFRLIAHIETRELPIYKLVVAKKGALIGAVQQSGNTVSASRGRIEVQASDSLAVLAEELSKVTGRDVIDQTGIIGRYNLKLQWAPDDLNTKATSEGSSGPSIFTALQEQLGLQLVSARGPVRILVIDNVARPSPN